MPELNTEIFGMPITIELNHEGEVMGYTHTDTGKEFDLDAVIMLPQQRYKLDNEVNEFMEEWRRELREHVRARGRDRLGDDK